MDPWEAVEPPHEAAWVPGAGQGGAAEPTQHHTGSIQSDGQARRRQWACRDDNTMPCLERHFDNWT